MTRNASNSDNDTKNNALETMDVDFDAHILGIEETIEESRVNEVEITSEPIYHSQSQNFKNVDRGRFPITAGINQESHQCSLVKDTWRVFDYFCIDDRKEDVDRLWVAQRATQLSTERDDVRLSHPHGSDTESVLQVEHYEICDEPQHFRLLLDHPYVDLTNFKTTYELVKVMKDAMEAHSVAYKKAGILHGNISPDTILVGENSKGYLVDWDKDHIFSNPIAMIQKLTRELGVEADLDLIEEVMRGRQSV